MDKEYIICSCINYNGVLVGGRNMRNCYETITTFISKPDTKVLNNNQGFITSTGRFVTREQAWVIASDAHQIKYEILKDFGSTKPFLMSINLFSDSLEEKEFIVCASINHNGTIINGYRHGNCYDALRGLVTLPEDQLPQRHHQGFLTSLNRFVDRKEAWKIAKANNQIKYGQEASENGEDSILISENLY